MNGWQDNMLMVTEFLEGGDLYTALQEGERPEEFQWYRK